MTNTLVLRPSGTGFEWCINQYDGCSHGCKYCYGMTIRKKKYEDWVRAKPRNNVIQNLKKDIQKLKKDNVVIKDIFLGSITDSYQPLERKHRLTRQIIEVLIQNDLPFTILTKNDLVLCDIDLFKSYNLCRVGMTVPSLDETFRKTLERNSVTYGKRIEALKELKGNNISTYLCTEPLFPVVEANPIDIVNKTEDVVDLFEFGRWSKYRIQGIPARYYKNYTDAYYVNLFKKVIRFCNANNVNYCISKHSEEFFTNHGLPFKPYPTLIP